METTETISILVSLHLASPRRWKADLLSSPLRDVSFVFSYKFKSAYNSFGLIVHGMVSNLSRGWSNALSLPIVFWIEVLRLILCKYKPNLGTNSSARGMLRLRMYDEFQQNEFAILYISNYII